MQKTICGRIYAKVLYFLVRVLAPRAWCGPRAASSTSWTTLIQLLAAAKYDANEALYEVALKALSLYNE